MLLRLTIFFALLLTGVGLLQHEGGASATGSWADQDIGLPLRSKAIKFAETDPVSEMSRKVLERTGHRKISTVFHERYLGSRTDRFKSSDNSMNSQPALFTGTAMPVPMLSIDGLANLDNVAAFGLIISPPDTIGEAGQDNYVQIANTLFRVHDKSGRPLTDPIPINSLFQKLQSPCSNRNDGLPNLIYDQFADRWLISQVCSLYPPFRQMIAVSQTGDPLGSWFAYEFVMPNVKINDFPKMSMWPDGYYMTTNEILGSDFTGTGVFAFDRKRMLAGDPAAGYVYFSISSTLTFPGGMLPADLDGLRPPPDGMPAIIATHTATEYGQPNDAIQLYDFHADFDDPSASYFHERAESPIVVAAFDPTSPEGRADISQPPPGEKLDSVSDTLMSRLAYRNFGGYQSLVANQTVRLTAANKPYRAGLRIYELRNTSGSYSPFVQSTVGDNTSSRWIGAAAQDNQGNLAFQYNLVSGKKRLAIAYSGRLSGDPPNAFRPERSLIDGTGVQKAYGWRWGEYSSMSVDPSDDCTFWITNSYYSLESEQFSDFGWLTRIGTFKFDECTPAPVAALMGTITDTAKGQPIAGASISASAYSRRSDPKGAFGPMRLFPGQYLITVSKPGYRDAARTVNISDGITQVENFALDPIAVIAPVSQAISSESCGMDHSVDPGETVTLDISLRNTGAKNIAALNVQMIAAGGVTLPGPKQDYGPMPSGGGPVSRPFTFTAESNLKCGEPLSLSFALADGANSIGTISINLLSGRPRIALKENFDRTAMGALPQRWTRQGFTANGALDPARDWKLWNTHITSGTKSLFSPAPLQSGMNEIVSPVFNITTSDAHLTFENWYELETTFLRNRLYDGSVLDIKIGEAPWQDIIAAGGQFLSGGYDGAIDACCQNPLAGRQGWSGWSGINRPAEFVKTEVKLPAAAAGQKVQLRWRVGTDLGTFREGQYIDDIAITDGRTCSCN